MLLDNVVAAVVGPDHEAAVLRSSRLLRVCPAVQPALHDAR